MRQYLLDGAPLAGYLHGRAPFVELITPLLQTHQAATSIMVYAEVIEYLKGLPDFSHRKKQLQTLLREVYPRKVMTGIIFVLKTGIPWKALPETRDFPSGHTCRRGLMEWHERGV